MNPQPAQWRCQAPLIDGEAEARLVLLACSQPPEGRAGWSLRLLADKMVELEIVESVSHETVRQTLKKNQIKPWLKEQWCIPPKEDAEFVCKMEDVLEVYALPQDPKIPLACVDEASKQQIGEVRKPLPAKPGETEKFDFECVRNGTANLFMIAELLVGARNILVSDRRTAAEFAKVLKHISDVLHPAAEKIRLVCDNLNTHGPACLYGAFEPTEARRLAERFEFHFTPKHASWLNMAELKLSVLTRQCLNRRLSDRRTLEREVAAWQAERNSSVKRVSWRLTTTDSRIKLKRLYPPRETRLSTSTPASPTR